MQVPHCVSSRFVLGHYHRCQDSKCHLCGPVRAVLARERDEQRLKGQADSSDEEEDEDEDVGGEDDDDDDDDDDL